MGATAIHFEQFSSAGKLTHGAMLLIVATHGLIALILLAALCASGLWRLHTSGERYDPPRGESPRTSSHGA